MSSAGGELGGDPGAALVVRGGDANAGLTGDGLSVAENTLGEGVGRAKGLRVRGGVAALLAREEEREEGKRGIVGGLPTELVRESRCARRVEGEGGAVLLLLLLLVLILASRVSRGG